MKKSIKKRARAPVFSRSFRFRLIAESGIGPSKVKKRKKIYNLFLSCLRKKGILFPHSRNGSPVPVPSV